VKGVNCDSSRSWGEVGRTIPGPGAVLSQLSSHFSSTAASFWVQSPRISEDKLRVPELAGKCSGLDLLPVEFHVAANREKPTKSPMRKRRFICIAIVSSGIHAVAGATLNFLRPSHADKAVDDDGAKGTRP